MTSSTLTYHLLRSRRRTIALIIEADGSLTVRAPLRAARAQIDALVAEKAAWIAEKQTLAQKSYTPPKAYRSGERFLFLGQEYPLEIVDKQSTALALQEGVFRLARRAVPQAGQVFERWYRGQARKLLEQRVAGYARQHGLHYTALRISGARQRWGSCSSKGSLNFSWRLALLPQELIDYVILHELAHLKVKNHSAQFWAYLAALLPDYKDRRARLKRFSTA